MIEDYRCRSNCIEPKHWCQTSKAHQVPTSTIPANFVRLYILTTPLNGKFEHLNEELDLCPHVESYDSLVLSAF